MALSANALEKILKILIESIHGLAEFGY